jgi:peptide/nickel transport system substrate-binding protein
VKLKSFLRNGKRSLKVIFLKLDLTLERYIGIIILLLIVAIITGSCVSSVPNTRIANRNPTGRISLGTTATIRTLDPADNTSFFASNVLYNTTERLYTYATGTTELIPQLASGMPKVSKDGLVYRIPIRKGVKFHDRTDFNAGAMAFSLNRFMQSGGAPAYILKDAIAKIQVDSPTELVIKLKQPLQLFPKLLAYTGAAAISPAVYRSRSPKDPKFYPNKIVGTGAYQMVQYEEGKTMRLDSFPDYWDKKPRNQGIDIQFFSSSANLLNAFKTGNVDVAFQTLSPNQIRNLSQNSATNGWKVISGKSSTILYMSLNMRQPPLNNVLVRQAIAAAIDRPLLQKRVFQNQRIPLYSLIPNTFSAYQPLFQINYGDGNGKLAQKLLTQAGFSKSNPAKITIWYNPNYAGNGDLVVSTLKASLEKSVGKSLQIEIEKVNQTTANSFIDRGVYPAFLFDWVPDISDPDNFLDPFLSCAKADAQGCIQGSSHLQGSFYNNPQVNQLIAQERQEKNPIKRDRLFKQIQEIVARDVPFIPLWQNQEYVFARSQITGAKIEPTQQLNYSFLAKS